MNTDECERMYHLEREINEQPDITRRLLIEGDDSAQTIARAIRDFDPQFVWIAARGTSDNAGRYAQYLMGIEARLPVGLATPSVHTLYESPPNLARALVIGISQSGQPEDVCRVISDARAQGALTLSLTNDPASRLADAADHHFDLRAGQEISVAATKTYTAELTAIAMLVAALVGKSELAEALIRLPAYLDETLTLCETIPAWVERYRYMDRFAVIGRGYNYCTAFEISQKVKELCSITVEEYSEADFRHGPIAIVQPGFPVMVVAPEGKPIPALLDLLAKLNERRAECLVISNQADALKAARTPIMLPAVPEWLSPIAAVIPGQVFALHLTIAKGYPVDKPAGLTKITNTI
jgi:glucosamine--fructose-6-phosphate aminotransferase (isomerizing)